jgi:Zn finger protein HypA/HybF involved in hydrogenase expression
MSDFTETIAETGNFIKCKDCGGNLKYLAGTPYLNCEYCGAKNEIVGEQQTVIIENDFEGFLNEKAHLEDKQEISTVKCTNCAASTTLQPNVTSCNCPYCDTPLVIQNASTSTIIKPAYVLPFKVDRKKSTQLFINWAGSLWFAPNKIKDYAQHSAEKLSGIYMPYWTYDANTESNYTGMRGVYYYVTVSSTNSEGKTVTRQERRTNWIPTSGNVSNAFDDVLVTSSKSLPEKLANELEPWDLTELVAYNDMYLSGFVTESYQVSLKEGFEKAKDRMQGTIRSTVCSDIGGDEQQITSLSTNYNDIKFKHILLPVWLSSYRYKEKVYRFLVNARTGEVQGERPYSAAKIAALVITVLAVIGLIVYFVQQK